MDSLSQGWGAASCSMPRAVHHPWSHPSERAAHVHTCSTTDATLLPPCCCAGARSKPRSAFWVHTTPAPSQVWRRWQGYCRRKGSCRKLSGCTGACPGHGPRDVCVMCRPYRTALLRPLAVGGWRAAHATPSFASCAAPHHTVWPPESHCFAPSSHVLAACVALSPLQA